MTRPSDPQRRGDLAGGHGDAARFAHTDLKLPPQRPKDATQTPAERLIRLLLLGLITALGITAVVVLLRVLPGAPPNPECLDGRLDGFFDKPAATEEEVEFQQRVHDYAIRLTGYGCDGGYQLSDFADPVEGKWIGDEGYFEFSQGAFYWTVELEGDDAEYYFAGSYEWLPGCEFGGALGMDRIDAPCYTLLLRYEQTMSSDVLSDDLYYGGLMIAQEGVGKSGEYLSMFNMRTGGSFYVDRLKE